MAESLSFEHPPTHESSPVSSLEDPRLAPSFEKGTKEIEEGLREFIESSPESSSPTQSLSRKIYEKFTAALPNIEESHAQQKPEIAQESVNNTFQDIRKDFEEQFGKEQTDTMFAEYDAAQEKTSRGMGRTVLSEAANFIPFAGPIKMMTESVAGRDLINGKKLEGKDRFLHGAEGAAYFALDFTGVGGVAGKAAGRGARLGYKSLRIGKVAGKVESRVPASQLFKRSAAITRSMGAPKMSNPLFQFGKFLEKNPMVGNQVDHIVEAGILHRNKRRSDLIGSSSELILSYFENDPTNTET